MKRTIAALFIISSIELFCISTFAQIRVMLQHNGTATPFSGISALVDANNAAANGDTIYLPGGYFTSISVSKRLVIVGTGHYPDSLKATGLTYLTSALGIGKGADSSLIEGLYVYGDINFTDGVKINDVTIRRCYFNSLRIVGGPLLCERILINQNVINGNVNLQNTTGVLLKNNIMSGFFYNIENGLIDHNAIITGIGGYTVMVQSVNNSLYQNNVFKNSFGDGSGFQNGSNNTFDKNAFNFDPRGGVNNFTPNNLYSIDNDSLFVKGNSYSFDYANNYHLKSTFTAGKNYSTEGNDIGIYGGLPVYTYKEYAMPFNPHIVSKTISQVTNSQGKINVNIKVTSQPK